MLHLCPDLVRTDLLDMSDDPDRTSGTIFSYPVSQTSLNGVTGFPSRATAENGANLFKEITDALEAAVRRAIIETPPLPAHEWQHIPKP